MSELDILKIVSAAQAAICVWAVWYIGAPMGLANGKRPLLRLLAACAVVDAWLAIVICSQTISQTKEVVHEPMTWVFQWNLRLVPACLAVAFVRTGQVIYRR